jgi:hypothetical protein
MRIVIPEEIGGSLRLLPPDTYEANLSDLFLGESQTKNPKVTLKFTITSEYTGKKDKDFQSCIGENILEMCSLQPQAVWKLNDYYKAATGERLPQGEFDDEEFESMLKEALVGKSFRLLVDNEIVPTTGEERTKVQKFEIIEKRKRPSRK